MATDGEALVVFIRPSRYGGPRPLSVLDEAGHFLGNALPSSHFAVSLPPGPHTFVVWAENADALQATLDAGKTYYVEVAPTLGAWSARASLLAIKPTSESWNKRRVWMTVTKAMASDFEAGEAYVNARRAAALAKIQEGREELRRAPLDAQQARTLAPGDGV